MNIQGRLVAGVPAPIAVGVPLVGVRGARAVVLRADVPGVARLSVAVGVGARIAGVSRLIGVGVSLPRVRAGRAAVLDVRAIASLGTAEGHVSGARRRGATRSRSPPRTTATGRALPPRSIRSTFLAPEISESGSYASWRWARGWILGGSGRPARRPWDGSSAPSSARPRSSGRSRRGASAKPEPTGTSARRPFP